MKRLRIGAPVLVAALALAGVGMTSPAAARGFRLKGRAGHGCPYGAFCIYPHRWSWRSGPEKHGIYYSYGAHNLHHQFGWHLVYNNQYRDGGYNAGANLCLGWNGRGGEYGGPITRERWAAIADLTNVNSVTLFKYDLNSWHWYNLAFCRG